MHEHCGGGKTRFMRGEIGSQKRIHTTLGTIKMIGCNQMGCVFNATSLEIVVAKNINNGMG